MHPQWQRSPLPLWMCVGPTISILVFEQCPSLLYPFCRTIWEKVRARISVNWLKVGRKKMTGMIFAAVLHPG